MAEFSQRSDLERSQTAAADGAAAGDMLADPHFHPTDLVADALGVDPAVGLSYGEAEFRRDRDGANTVEHDAGYKWWSILLGQFTSIVVWLLGFAAAVAWLTGNELEGVAILIVLLINALIGFAVEWRAGRALDALRREAVASARVRRDGADQIVDAAELVAGDIVILTAGDRVPADARLLEAVSLRTDESTLTGESEPVGKSIDPVASASLLAERSSMVYLATTVVGGKATAIVTATGPRTELGRIGQLIAKSDSEKTPLERKLQVLGTQLVYIVLAIAAVVLAAGVIRGDGLWLMLEVSISLAVAAVPEGLPAVTTLILALGVLQMARRKAIVRRLAAVEALGSTTVICTDKTGTLTENRMTVRQYFLSDGKVIDVEGGVTAVEDPIFRRLLRVSMLCSEASLSDTPGGIQAIGDPTETALLTAAAAFGVNVGDERGQYKKLLEHPFDAASKRMISVLADGSGSCYSMMKGGPKVVLDACTAFTDGGSLRPLDERQRRSFIAINEEMAGRGLRVLAFAEKPFEPGEAENIASGGECDVENGYVFLGFAGMSDPPRTGVAEALCDAHTAGIRVIMLTGDQLSTARAIAGELRLNLSGDITAFNAHDILDASGSELADIAGRADVFARVSPEEKLRIVEALKQNGEIVAVTGDGINDAPALKFADIGIAMGERGTEVAKEASDIVLADDNFSTIVAAIAGGRTIYANIIKFVNLLFSENLAEVIVIFTAILAGLPLPLLPLQILWVNLVTDVFPAMALAVEKPTADIMHRGPRPPGRSLLTRSFFVVIGLQGVLLAAISLAAYIWALELYGPGPHARTVALFTLIGVQLGHLFNCRSRTRSAFDGFFTNPYIFAAVAAVILLQVMAVSLGPLARVLDVVPPNMNDWLVIAASTLVPIIVVEIAKLIFRRRVYSEVT